MSEPDWLGPATDALKDKCLHEAADLLAKAPAKADLLERMVVFQEDRVQTYTRMFGLADDYGPDSIQVAMIAEHRGETPDATLARLSPPRGFDPARHSNWATSNSTPVADIRAIQEMHRSFGVPMGPPPPPPDPLDLSFHSDMERLERQALRRNRAEIITPPIDLTHALEAALIHERSEVEAFLREHFLDGRAGVGTHEHIVYPMGADGRRLHAIVPKAEAPSGDRLLPPDEAIARYPTRLI